MARGTWSDAWTSSLSTSPPRRSHRSAGSIGLGDAEAEGQEKLVPEARWAGDAPCSAGDHVLLSSPLWGAPGGLPLDILGLAGAWVSLSLCWLLSGYVLGVSRPCPGGHSGWVGCAGVPAGWGAHPAWCERLGSPMASPFLGYTGLRGQRESRRPEHAPHPPGLHSGVAAARSARRLEVSLGPTPTPAGLQLTKIPGACSHLLPRPCRRAKAREVALFGRLSRWAVSSALEPGRLQVSVFHRLLISVYVTEQLTAASKGCTRSFLGHLTAGRGGAGRRSWNELKPTYGGRLTQPGRNSLFMARQEGNHSRA